MLRNKQADTRITHRSRPLTDIPHTRRPRARPTPAGRKGSDSLGRTAEYHALHVQERSVTEEGSLDSPPW